MNKLKTLKYKTTSPENGLFNKITKRYSTVSAKFMRKSPGRSKSVPTPTQHISSGSYDMSGHLSEDHKLEIGAPVLISKTTIDTDFSDTNDLMDTSYRLSSIHTSSESETEIYTDAISSLPNVHDIKFEFLSKNNNENIDFNNLTDSSINYYEIPTKMTKSIEIQQPSRSQKIDRSKSAQNLHKSELKVYLQKCPSLELNMKLTTTADLENCYDLPRRYSTNTTELKTPTKPPILTSQSEPNTPSCPPPEQINLPTISNHYKSVDSLNKGNGLRKSVVFASSTSVKCNKNTLNMSTEDFDMKSVSFQSLNAKNIFLSIEELNEITRQINDSENFENDIDLEYCEHRDNLRPNERRITLLKNKNSRLINFNQKRERINHAWSGLKHWIGEESGRFKVVIQKHAAMQRVGGVQNGTTSDGDGILMKLRQDQSKISDKSRRSDGETSYASSTLSVTKSSSGPTIVGEDEINFQGDDGESTFKRRQREISPFSKKPKIKDSWEGQNGFEELRRYVKQGGDFGKDLVAILQERVESEQLYAKSLSKMASKLNKACREIPGSVADAWRGVATEMEGRSEVHRQFSSSLVDEIVKPLKSILDNQHKSRKSIESSVDKASRILSEWRVSEGKAKKVSHTAARENEKLQDAMLDVRIQRSPSMALLQHGTGGGKNGADKELKSAEKDCAKLDNKRRKAEEAVKRSDVEYYTLCVRAERARVDWEMSVLRGSSILQNLESQRLVNMKNFVSTYLRLTSEINPIVEGLVERLTPQIDACNVQKDLIIVKNIRRASEGPSEQLLPDFYCEHTTLAMNRERRKHAIIKLLQLVRTDLDRERRSRNGLKNLSQTLSTQDNQNITDKLYHIRSMLTYLEGARFKLQSALLELDHKPRNSHPLAAHIQITRDRTGLQQSILKVPLWLKNDDKINSDSCDTDLDLESQTNNNCLDIKNDTLIKHFDKNFNRTKSNSELHINNNQEICTNDDKIPKLLKHHKNSDSPEFDRGIADGGSNQPDSDFDEFSSQDDEDELSITKDIIDCGDNNIPTTINDTNSEQINNSNSSNIKTIVISRCKALYSYTPKLYDELELTPGDIIEVHTKQEDGWWLGALKNQIGIFPATYVEEIV